MVAKSQEDEPASFSRKMSAWEVPGWQMSIPIIELYDPWIHAALRVSWEKDIRSGNRTIAIASDFHVDGAKSPEIPQKEGVLGSEIAARNRRSLATFHRTLKSQCIIAVSCLGNRAISGVRDGHRNRKSQKSLRFRCAKLWGLRKLSWIGVQIMVSAVSPVFIERASSLFEVHALHRAVRKAHAKWHKVQKSFSVVSCDFLQESAQNSGIAPRGCAK